MDLIGVELLSVKYSRIPPTNEDTCGFPNAKHSNTVNSKPPPLQLLHPTSQQLYNILISLSDNCCGFDTSIIVFLT